MKKFILLSSFLISLAFSAPYSAELESYTAQYEQCLSNSNGVTINMLDCIEQEYQKQDKRLNSLYSQLMAKLDNTQKQKLRNAQRQWIKFRDLNCEYYLNDDGGSFAIIASSECNLHMTTERADELQSMLDILL